MEKDDIITVIDRHKIAGDEEMISYVQGKKSVVDPIVFSVYRNGQILNLRTVLQAISQHNSIREANSTIIQDSAISNRSHIRHV
jgi:hypothetical protein